MQLLQFLQELLFFAAYVGASNSFPEPLPPQEEKKWIARLKLDDPEAREKLILHNLRLVAHIARKYTRSGRDTDDVVSIGTIGLIKAVSTYDPDKGTPLSSYASRCVENEILMSIRAERRQVQEVSISGAIGDDGDGNDVTLADLIGTDADMVVDLVAQKLRRDEIHGAMQRVLNQRERIVLSLRYGLNDGVRMPQREIARLIGISRSYVSRIEKRALQQLAKELQSME